MIYDYALVIGNVIPYQDANTAALSKCEYPLSPVYEHPSVHMLNTCRLIHAEASSTLYSRNTFLLPTTSLTKEFFTKALHNPTRRSWVKSVYLMLWPEDMNQTERQVLGDKVREYESTSPEVPSHYISVKMHAADKLHVRLVSWPQKVNLILDHLALDKLVVNLAGSICHFRCCWQEPGAILAFQKGFAHGMPAFFRMYWCEHDYTKDAKLCVQKWTEQRKQPSVSLRQGLETIERLQDPILSKVPEWKDNRPETWYTMDFFSLGDFEASDL